MGFEKSITARTTAGLSGSDQVPARAAPEAAAAAEGALRAQRRRPAQGPLSRRALFSFQWTLTELRALDLRLRCS